MPGMTVLFGVILMAMGVGGYLGTGRASVTALIPAGFGVVFVVCGVLARNERMLKHAMHGAALFGLLGAAGSFPGVIKLFRSFGGTALERPVAVYLQTAMCGLCVLFVVLCVNSFVQVRKRRNAASG